MKYEINMYFNFNTPSLQRPVISPAFFSFLFSPFFYYTIFSLVSLIAVSQRGFVYFLLCFSTHLHVDILCIIHVTDWTKQKTDVQTKRTVHGKLQRSNREKCKRFPVSHFIRQILIGHLHNSFI